MPTFELEDSGFAGYMQEDDVFQAVVASVKIVEKPYKEDDGVTPVKKVEFKFTVQDDGGSFDGQNIWGETPVKFNNHPDCKLRNWASMIMGAELPVGYKLDTDILVGNLCRIVVRLKEYTQDGKDKKRNEVKDVMLSREAQAAVAYAGTAEEPF